MRKFLLPLLATAALVTPAAAAAHGWHHHHALAKLSGTGTSFANATATASGQIVRSEKLGLGTFAASLATDWSKATTRTGERGTLSCAPATATLTLTGANVANTASASLTGKTCTFTKTDGTVVRGFLGRGTATGTGTLSALTTAKAFLVQRSDGTVRGAVFGGRKDAEGTRLTFATALSFGEHHCDR